MSFYKIFYTFYIFYVFVNRVVFINKNTFFYLLKNSLIIQKTIKD